MEASKKTPLFCRIDCKTALCILSVLALLLCLAATVAIAPYNTLHSDDVLSSGLTAAKWNETHSLSETARFVLSTTVSFYRSWQGTYTSALLVNTLSPLFIDSAPWLMPVVMLLLTGVCVVLFTRAALRPFPAADRKTRCILNCFALIGMTQLLPSAFEGYFWFSCAILYTFSYCLLLLLGTALLNLPHTKKPLPFALKAAACILMAVMLGGGCYPVLPPAFLLLSFCVVWRIARKDRRGAWLGGATLAVFLVGAAANVLSPGNAARMQFIGAATDSRSIVGTVFASVVTAVVTLPKLIDGCLLLFVLLTAVFAVAFVKGSPHRFRMPWLAAILGFGVYASMFAPMLYTMGDMGPARAQNIYYFALYPILGFCTAYIAGAAVRHAEKRRHAAPAKPCRVCAFLNRHGLIAASAIMAALALGMLLHGPRAVTAYAAVRELKTGIAQTYHAAKLAERNGVPLPDNLVQSDLLP